MADPVLKAGFARDVALLRLVGMKPIVVHGGGWRIDELLRQIARLNDRLSEAEDPAPASPPEKPPHY